MAVGKRKKLDTGIYRDAHGHRVYQRVHAGRGGLKSQRFPRTATLTAMKAWQEEQRVAYRQDHPTRRAAERGTLSADIDRYLKLVATMPSYDDRERDLRAWEAIYGAQDRASLTREDFQRTLQEWRQSGRKGKPLAASSVNHRRTALMHLYTTLDGRGAPNPLRDIKAFREPPPEPRDLGLDTVRALLAAMPDSKTRARIAVLAWTGIRGPSEFGKMHARHLDLQAGVCWVPTGKNGRPRQLPLHAEGIAAWKDVIRLNAWGEYSAASVRHSFARAVKAVNAARAKAKQPPLVGVRVYDLRHTIATALLKAGADLADVQAFLGHTTPAMTRRYAPYQSDKLRTALGALTTGNFAGNFSASKQAHSGPSAADVRSAGNRRSRGKRTKIA